jgi:hypothetical protein
MLEDSTSKVWISDVDPAEGNSVAFHPLLNDARAAIRPKTPTNIYG